MSRLRRMALSHRFFVCGEGGVLLQGQFFDRMLRTVKEYHEAVEYIH